MKINKDSLSARIQKISKEKEIDPTLIYSRFFFDSFLIRLSKSRYADKFILKGGLLLSSVLGIENRATIDMDFLLKKVEMEREVMMSMVNDICAMPTDDNVSFKCIGCSEIKRNDIYGGLSISIEGRLDNIRQKFDIDLAVGDVVFPGDTKFSHECLITKERISVACYSMESVCAEKMHAFLSLGHLNSRTKDIYDLYILEKLMLTSKNLCQYKDAFLLTCKARGLAIDKQKAMYVYNEFLSNPDQAKRWASFAKKSNYSRNISFNEAMTSIKKLILMFYE